MVWTRADNWLMKAFVSLSLEETAERWRLVGNQLLAWNNEMTNPLTHSPGEPRVKSAPGTTAVFFMAVRISLTTA